MSGANRNHGMRLIVSLGILAASASAWTFSAPASVSTRHPSHNSVIPLKQRHRGSLLALPTSKLETAIIPRSTNVACRVSVAAEEKVVTKIEKEEQQQPPAVLQPEQSFLESQEFKNVMNALLLIASFGYALYTILNIDHGMTRGWTQSEIAMRIPVDNWNLYETALSDKPVETKTLINVVIYLLGDWLSQTLFQKKNVLDFDAKRTLRNGFIGLCFGPLVHMYYEWSDAILPVEAGLWNRVQKIFMDQTLYLSVKCSIYIMAVGLLGGEDIRTVSGNVKERIVPIMFTAWKFWPLVHCITYGVIPARHRILWVNSVDLVWNAILASAVVDEPEVLEEEVVEEDVELDESHPAYVRIPLEEKLGEKENSDALLELPALEEDEVVVLDKTTVSADNGTVGADCVEA